MLQNIWQDVRYGFRGLVNRPSFTAIAVLTIALGIGSAAAIFSVIQNVLLDPAPYADVERIASPRFATPATQTAAGAPLFRFLNSLNTSGKVRSSTTSLVEVSTTS